jgi:putative NADH-flavin reductase
MKLVLFGATGMVGSRIAAEAARRGYEVVAVSRSGRSPVDSPAVTAVCGNASDPVQVAELVRGADAVISAVAPARDGANPREPFLAAQESLLRGLRAAHVTRIVIVGGAGSLTTSSGVALVDTPEVPDELKPESRVHEEFLGRLRAIDDLDWTYISPAAVLAPGERTNKFRIDGDDLLTDAEGHSSISAEDYAIALVDEVEKGEHPRTRISVAY